MSRVAKRTRLDKNVIQQFISDSPWDADAVLATNISTMSRKFSDDKGILVVDDTGQGKQGTKSPGVKRQYGTINIMSDLAIQEIPEVHFVLFSQ